MAGITRKERFLVPRGNLSKGMTPGSAGEGLHQPSKRAKATTPPLTDRERKQRDKAAREARKAARIAQNGEQSTETELDSDIPELIEEVSADEPAGETNSLDSGQNTAAVADEDVQIPDIAVTETEVQPAATSGTTATANTTVQSPDIVMPEAEVPKTQPAVTAVADKVIATPDITISEPEVAETLPPSIPHLTKPISKPKPQIPDRRESIAPPKPGEVIVVLDASTIIDLCQRIDGLKQGDGPIGLDLIKKALGFQEIAKVVIPDYIADFEMKGIGRSYSITDIPSDSESAHKKLRSQQVRRFSAFLHGAVRRHIDNRGKECFLTEAGIPPAEINENIVIWETAQGRAAGEDIYETIHNRNHGHRDPANNKNKGKSLVRDKYMPRSEADPDASDLPATGRDRGELCIEEFVDKEIPWKNPVLILSRDSRYTTSPDNAETTLHGNPKLYMSTRHFIETVLRKSPRDVLSELNLTGHDATQHAVTISKRIATERCEEGETPKKESLPPMVGNRQLISRQAPALSALIPKGQKVIKPEPQPVATPASSAFLAPPARIPTSANTTSTISTPVTVASDTPVIARVESPAPPAKPVPLTSTAKGDSGLPLRKAIMAGMIAEHLSFEGLADRINERVPDMPPMTTKMLAGILSGQHKIVDDHLYALIEFLVDSNPKIREEDKKDEAFALLHKHREASHEHDKADAVIDRDKYHALGTYVCDKMEQMDITDLKVFCDKLNAEVAKLHLKPEEGKITPETVGGIVIGESIPSPGLALALRKVLHQTSDPTLFDAAYIKARFENPALQDRGRA